MSDTSATLNAAVNVVYVASINTSNVITHVGSHANDVNLAAYLKITGGFQITEAVYKQIMVSPTTTFSWNATTSTATAVVADFNLSSAISQASNIVDAQAEATRLLVITPGAGQSQAYSLKFAEAQAFLTQYSTDSAASSATATDWPMLSAEVGITGADLFATATVIKQLGTQWIVLCAAIEGIRLGTKAKLALAKAQTDINTIMSALTWPNVT